MPRFDPPEAEWTDEYEWTRYRGPDPWPCPADWVFNDADALGAGWYRYPGIGEGHAKDAEVVEIVGYDDIEEHREEMALLVGEDAGSSRREERIEWRLSVKGETVFRRVNPNRADLMAAVAETLSRYSNGSMSWRSVEPSTGSVPDDVKRERELEKRREQNASLDGFGGAEQ